MEQSQGFGTMCAMNKSLFAILLFVSTPAFSQADGPAMRALKQSAAAQPNLLASPDVMKAASDAQVAPIAGAPVEPAIVLADSEPENRFYGDTVKKDATKGRDIAVKVTHKPMRFLASAAKLPFAGIGGIFGGLYGAARGFFASDDDDHNNSVGAGFMLGAAAVGQIAGKVFEKILSIPVIVAGAVGTLVGGLVGLVRGLFSKE